MFRHRESPQLVEQRDRAGRESRSLGMTLKRCLEQAANGRDLEVEGNEVRVGQDTFNALSQSSR